MNLNFRVTERIQSAIAFASQNYSEEELTLDGANIIAQHTKSDISSEIPFTTVHTLSKILQKKPKKLSQDDNFKLFENRYLHELLFESSPAVELKKVEKKRDPEYEKRMQRLRAEYERRQYDKMTENVKQRRDTGLVEEGEMASLNDQMSIGLNIIVSMVTMFVVGWWLFGKMGPVWGICGGLFCGIGTMMVEVWLFIIRADTGRQQMASKAHKLEKKLLYPEKEDAASKQTRHVISKTIISPSGITMEEYDSEGKLLVTKDQESKKEK